MLSNLTELWSPFYGIWCFFLKSIVSFSEYLGVAFTGVKHVLVCFRLSFPRPWRRSALCRLPSLLYFKSPAVAFYNPHIFAALSLAKTICLFNSRQLALPWWLKDSFFFFSPPMFVLRLAQVTPSNQTVCVHQVHLISLDSLRITSLTGVCAFPKSGSELKSNSIDGDIKLFFIWTGLMFHC